MEELLGVFWKPNTPFVIHTNNNFIDLPSTPFIDSKKLLLVQMKNQIRKPPTLSAATTSCVLTDGHPISPFVLLLLFIYFFSPSRYAKMSGLTYSHLDYYPFSVTSKARRPRPGTENLQKISLLLANPKKY